MTIVLSIINSVVGCAMCDGMNNISCQVIFVQIYANVCQTTKKWAKNNLASTLRKYLYISELRGVKNKKLGFS